MSKDFYQVLGVSKTSSTDEIKKAFRKLAHEHHPDKKGGTDAKFKEINEAYQVLSNPEKRKQYDQFGSSFESAGGPGGFNWNDWQNSSGFQGNINIDDLGDIFGDMFGFGGRQRGGPRGGGDLQVEMAIDFEEAVFGVVKKMRLEKEIICSKCNGSGAEAGSKIVSCTTCNGSGQVHQVQRTFLGTIQTATVCNVCGGTGSKPEKACAHCRGLGKERGIRNLDVKIPAGIDSGQLIRIDGEGQLGDKGTKPGDLLLYVVVRPHKIFTRHGHNLLTNKEISLSLAVVGGKVALTTLDGEVSLKIPSGTQSGTVFKITGRGVPYIRSTKRGDLMVTVNVKIPGRLGKKEKDLLKGLDINKGEELEGGLFS